MQLVRGYMVQVQGLEVLYAVFEGGEIFHRETGKVYNSSFLGRKNTVWHKTDKLPVYAEYIGNYPEPRNLR